MREWCKERSHFARSEDMTHIMAGRVKRRLCQDCKQKKIAREAQRQKTRGG